MHTRVSDNAGEFTDLLNRLLPITDSCYVMLIITRYRRRPFLPFSNALSNIGHDLKLLVHARPIQVRREGAKPNSAIN